MHKTIGLLQYVTALCFTKKVQQFKVGEKKC